MLILVVSGSLGEEKFCGVFSPSIFLSSALNRHSCVWHIYSFLFKPMRKQTAWEPLGVVYHNNEANDEWKWNRLHLQTTVNETEMIH